MQALVKRGNSNTYTINPLAHRFKESSPLIYDMASYVIKEVSKYYHIHVVDDEIAFIAFHIGSYIETSRKNDEKTDCCIVYVDYNDIYMKSIEKIISQLSSIMHVSKTVSVKDIDKIPEATELLITCCDNLPNMPKPKIITNLLISDNDIYKIRESVEKINHEKKVKKFKENIRYFINNDLFKKDFYTKDNIEMIQILAQDCCKKHLVSSEFVEDVIERETLSSTSFSNGLAMPHSLKANANKSFFYIVLNSKGMKWGDNTVNIILLIGTAENDRRAFKVVFDGMIELLYEKENIRKLLKCPDYDSFIDMLISLF